jgi:beta-1,4-mannosyltransferase
LVAFDANAPAVYRRHRQRGKGLGEGNAAAAMANSRRRRRVAVVVLGDVGRSPRMQYHAVALAGCGADVDLIGYGGSATYPMLRENDRIRCHLLRPPPSQPTAGSQPAALVSALLKVLKQSLQVLWWLVFALPRPDQILVQNPPAIPTLLLALVAARTRRTRLVIDWHNFGFSMLALRLGNTHPAVRLARWYEYAVARRADAHLCVSRAMQAVLAAEGNIQATILYDRPAEIFAPTAPADRCDLFRRLQAEIGWPAVPCPDGQRPALIVSPTSWTADEDFDLLLDATMQCDQFSWERERATGQGFPTLVVLITGKGPRRRQFEEQIRRLSLRKIQLRTLWLAFEDYASLLGAADLGLCLHRSASGIDLPMKIADMFGAGLPVCALNYGPCLAERVRDGETGLLFTTGRDLAEQLYELFKGFPHDRALLDKFRCNVSALRSPSWFDGWKAEAQSIFFGPEGAAVGT